MNDSNQHLLLISALSASGLITACGGSSGGGITGGGGETEPLPPIEPSIQEGGIWEGTTTANINSSLLAPEEISLFTTDDGQFRIVGSSAIQASGSTVVAEGETDADDDVLIGSVTAFAPQGFFFSDGIETSSCDITAIFAEAESITGTYECTDPADNGAFEATYNADQYEQDSSISLVEGTWSGLDANTTNNDVDLTFTVADNGSFTGQNSLGCNLIGAIDEIDNDFNLYEIRITLADCAELNGTYTGLATYRPQSNAQDELFYQVDNGDIILTQVVLR